MSKKIKGILKDIHAGTEKTGYQPVWEIGKAGDNKKRSRMTGVNRPSE